MSGPQTRRLHLLGLVLLLLIGLEAGCWLLLRLATGKPASDVRRRLMEAGPAAGLEQIEARGSGLDWLRNKVLHPYIGFVGNPHHPGPMTEHLNDFGFHGPLPPLVGETDQEVMAITGGSVAWIFFRHAREHETFRQQLRRLPAFAERDPMIVSLALDGMKQPQQLMTLNYFLSQGRKIDYLINLDGFNEVVLPITDNLPHGVAPSYPRSWNWHAARAVSSGQAARFGRIALSRMRADAWRRRLAATPLRYSSFCLTLWHLLDGRRQARESTWEAQLLGGVDRPEGPRPPDYAPVYPDKPLPAILEDNVAVWRRSSVQMWRLCEANGIRYLHALQPNQYLAGSKPLSDEEQRTALGPPSFVFRQPAEKGFPILRRVGRELAAEGVPFVDLTDVFEGYEETVYVDRCCHFNRRGNELVGARIAEALARWSPPLEQVSGR